MPLTLAALVAVACAGERSQEEPPWTSPVAFDTGHVRIMTATDTLRMQVEIAATEAQQQFGLMDRPVLTPGTGMLFVYPTVRDTTAGFWMFRTRVPLDIAFIDSTSRIASIRSMDPCQSPNPSLCRTYLPGARYRSALEVNRGWFAGNGIGPGDRVVQEPPARAR